MATVVGLFETTAQAQSAVEQLRSYGIAPGDISVAMQSAQAGATDTVADASASIKADTAATWTCTEDSLEWLRRRRGIRVSLLFRFPYYRSMGRRVRRAYLPVVRSILIERRRISSCASIARNGPKCQSQRRCYYE